MKPAHNWPSQRREKDMYQMFSDQGSTEHDSFVAALRSAEWQAQFSGSATVGRSDADRGVEVLYDEDESGVGRWQYSIAETLP